MSKKAGCLDNGEGGTTPPNQQTSKQTPSDVCVYGISRRDLRNDAIFVVCASYLTSQTRLRVSVILSLDYSIRYTGSMHQVEMPGVVYASMLDYYSTIYQIV